MSARTFITIVLTILTVSQIYWFVRAWRSTAKAGLSKPARTALAVAGLAFYLAACGFTFNWFGRRPTPTFLTLADALLSAPLLWWLPTSLVAFLVAIPFLILRAVLWIGRRIRKMARRAGEPLASPARRQFLEHATTAAAAVPFVAGAYGLLYGRLNLETPRQHIWLPRLPQAFEGFRIVQLSDIHIGPFMPAEQIRKYVQIANALKPDMVVLTGDYITWDPSTQQPVVDALSGLKAPFGVFGSLGNHELWSNTTASITALFGRAGIRILRGARVPVTANGASLNLIGIDYDSGGTRGDSPRTRPYLRGVESLVAPETVNILLSHNPNTFDRAAELGIDLSLAGHTHGGQVSLEFISPNIAPSRLVTDYVAGLFKKPGGQLYVNRGIGIFAIPIRAGSPPEITVFELTRRA